MSTTWEGQLLEVCTTLLPGFQFLCYYRILLALSNQWYILIGLCQGCMGGCVCHVTTIRFRWRSHGLIFFIIFALHLEDVLNTIQEITTKAHCTGLVFGFNLKVCLVLQQMLSCNPPPPGHAAFKPKILAFFSFACTALSRPLCYRLRPPTNVLYSPG